MSGKRRRPLKRDGNEAALVKAARQFGASWMSLNVTDGPDGVLGYQGCDRLVHVKQPGKKLTKIQQDYAATWRGRTFTCVSTVEDMVALLMGMGNIE